ncbi:MAG: hypothetical protein IJR14_03925 [Synergistaceae bacterium]|nr:hypothetical protein [Synergistaceae bacterium]
MKDAWTREELLSALRRMQDGHLAIMKRSPTPKNADDHGFIVTGAIELLWSVGVFEGDEILDAEYGWDSEWHEAKIARAERRRRASCTTAGCA